MMRRISRRRWGAIALGAVPAFGVTACSARKGNGMFDQVEVAKPLEERQTIEDHRAAVEVQLGRVDPASTRTPAPPPPSGPGAEFTSALPGSEKRR